MNKKSQRHLEYIIKSLTKRVRSKYAKGAKEHKGNLFEVDCLEEALDELVDTIVYLLTLKRK